MNWERMKIDKILFLGVNGRIEHGKKAESGEWGERNDEVIKKAGCFTWNKESVRQQLLGHSFDSKICSDTANSNVVRNILRFIFVLEI